jgi:hypothetical protein
MAAKSNTVVMLVSFLAIPLVIPAQRLSRQLSNQGPFGLIEHGFRASPPSSDKEFCACGEVFDVN